MQPNSDYILAVERKLVADRNSAARAEWQVLIRALFLQVVLGNVICFKGRQNRGIANCEAADLSSRRHVLFEEQRRECKDVSVVVEAVSGIVGGQKGIAVNVDRKQVADCVGIFGAVQPPDSRSAGIGVGRRRTIEFGLQICD